MPVPDQLSEMCFADILPREVPVTIGETRYVLREASGAAAVAYRNAAMKAVRMTGGSPSGIDGLADTEPLLVSLCLFTADGNKPVPLTTIKAWPNRVMRDLYERCKEISDLDDSPAGRKKADDAAGKPSAGTGLGSESPAV